MKRREEMRAGTSNWSQPLTPRLFVMLVLASLGVAGLVASFTVFFDIILTSIGYIFMYFLAPFLTFTCFFLVEKWRFRWTGVFLFGFNGLLGIPIEYIIEWKIEATLVSPWAALGWAVIYFMYGLSLDIPLQVTRAKGMKIWSVIIPAITLSSTLIFLSIVPLTWFYKQSAADAVHFLTYGYFLIPYGIMQGVGGAWLGHVIGSSSPRHIRA